MKGRLYRFTPAGGKPEHYAHDFRSACVGLDSRERDWLSRLDEGDALTVITGTWVRVA